MSESKHETDVRRWSEATARRELAAAKTAGAVPARQFHYGRAVVLLMDAGRYDEAALYLHDGLHRTGSYGSQFVAGMRAGVVLLDGARSIRALDHAENIGAWQEGEPYPTDADADADAERV